MTRPRVSRLAPTMAVVSAAATSAFLMIAASVPAQAAIKAGPHIVANPNNLMVNTVTNLTGSGFKPATTYTVQECSKTIWVVGQKPCATSNTVTVTTNASGGFKTRMTAVVCPKVSSARRGFSETCYIGVPKPAGLDSIKLIGAAKITVTGP
ncbi:MAG TPA: neocarzinostatin apoprotein domain-containing protein [Streptosporangiaceae bacterium]|nr:neocarzinostatin apoprotein domain-containing protein [Streptosporangiaceae bacterium]